VYGQGSSDRSPTHHSIFPVDLLKLLPWDRTVWFGFTGSSSQKKGEFLVHSVCVKHLMPALAKSKVYWPDGLAPRPFQPGTFYLQLRDECDRAMARAHGGLSVSLQLIDSMHPRASVQVDGDGPDVFVRRGDRRSLLYDHSGYVVEARAVFDGSRRIYRVEYGCEVPGRYRIMLRVGEGGAWTAVQWHTILVRPFF
jgi:hypothetical protein